MKFLLKMKKAAVLLFSLLLIQSCKSENKTVENEDIVGRIKNAENISILFEKPKDIFLDSKKEGLLSSAWEVQVLDNGNFLAVDIIQGVKIYSKEGKYIRDIGKRGHGPGEYIYISDVIYNSSSIVIFSSDSNKLLFYDYNGKYIKSYTLNYRYSDFVFYDSDKIAALRFDIAADGYKDYTIDFYDSSGKIESQIGPVNISSPKTQSVGPEKSNIILVNGNRLFLVLYNDIIINCYDIKSKQLLWKTAFLPKQINTAPIEKGDLVSREKLMNFINRHSSVQSLNIIKDRIVELATFEGLIFYDTNGEFMNFVPYNKKEYFPPNHIIKEEYLYAMLPPVTKEVSTGKENHKVSIYKIKVF